MCQPFLIFVDKNGRDKYNVHIQSRAVITQFNIVRYYRNSCANWGRISIRCWFQKDTPYPALTGELWGVFYEYLWECRLRYNDTALYMQPDTYIGGNWCHNITVGPLNLSPNGNLEQCTWSFLRNICAITLHPWYFRLVPITKGIGIENNLTLVCCVVYDMENW